MEYRNKITEKFNKTEGEIKVFNEVLNKIEALKLDPLYINNRSLNHIEDYLLIEGILQYDLTFD